MLNMIEGLKERVRRKLIEHNSQKHQVVLVTGVECSGKTHFTTDYLSKCSPVSLDGIFDSLVGEFEEDSTTLAERIDEHRLNEFATHNSFSDVAVAITLLEAIKKTEELLNQGKRVAIEGVMPSSETREWFVHSLRTVTDGSIACYFMDTPLEICLERLEKRGPNFHNSLRILNEDTIRDSFERFARPDLKKEGFNEGLDIKP